MTPAEFAAQVAQIASRVQEALAEGRPLTAWELKLRLKVSHSQLCMALGALLRSGAVQMTPSELTYKIEPALRTEAPRPPEASLAHASEG